MYNINVNNENVSVNMRYSDLVRIMNECVTTTLRSVELEHKKMSEQKWVDTTHTAKMFGCHVSTINRWKHSGYLTPRSIGGKDFFSVDEIKERMMTKSA